MAKLRKLSKKITPVFKYDPENPDASTEKIDELKDGEKGKGIFVRKYIKDLDMDFYAGRSIEKGRETIPVTFRVPEDIAKDISIMLATQRTRFRDRSEFIRTAIYILMNYYSQIVEGQFKERVSLRKTEDLIEWEKSEGLRLRKIVDLFDTQFSAVAEDGDEVLHKYLVKIVDSVKTEKRPHIKNKLIRAFGQRMEQAGVDPLEYFDNYKSVKE